MFAYCLRIKKQKLADVAVTELRESEEGYK